jgi:uncharacterized delta-60 repeat protein
MPSVFKTAAVLTIAAAALFTQLAQASGALIVDLDANSIDQGAALALGPDGRLYVSGASQADSSSSFQWRILAFDASGEPVASFGSGGRLDAPALVLAVRPDKALVHSDGDSVLIRDAAGTQQSDTALPTTTGPAGFAYANSIATLADNRTLVAGGFTRGSVSDFWTLTRLKADGSFDSTFGAGIGSLQPDAGVSREISSVKILPDGKILALGASSIYSIGSPSAVLGRFNADGAVDFSFGTNGLIEWTDYFRGMRAILPSSASGAG